eukprot:TRINITY_DN14947_c0_g2_i1.p2 TRINITY_DN14947_c0_g2~~TRINITY_DN14947_c0_g2_i1.p2  ORF type:complete len:175 (+),score=67.84 TRINITY_DN14947_c0_g2_i1:540-1064(+)
MAQEEAARAKQSADKLLEERELKEKELRSQMEAQKREQIDKLYHRVLEEELSIEQQLSDRAAELESELLRELEERCARDAEMEEKVVAETLRLKEVHQVEQAACRRAQEELEASRRSAMEARLNQLESRMEQETQQHLDGVEARMKQEVENEIDQEYERRKLSLMLKYGVTMRP